MNRCVEGGMNPKHHATHVIDDGCTDMMKTANMMIGAAVSIRSSGELRVLVAAIRVLHAKATAEHERFEASK